MSSIILLSAGVISISLSYGVSLLRFTTDSLSVRVSAIRNFFSTTTVPLRKEAWLSRVLRRLLWRLRRKIFLASLPDALDTLLSGLQAGYTLEHSIAITAREASSSVAGVFKTITASYRYALSFGDVLDSINADLPIVEWGPVSETLRLAEKNSSYSVILISEIAASLREHVRIEREVLSATASSRLSGFVIAAIAPISFFLMYLFVPDYCSVLFDSHAGKLLLTSAIVLEVIGFFFINRLTKV